MTPTVIEAGPGTIRRLEAGARVRGGAAEPDMVAAALDALDEPVTLVGEQPVSVDAVWRSVLASVLGGRRSAVIVHPSRWTAARVARVTAAARTVTDDVVTLKRASLLAGAAAGTPAVVVEIDSMLVVISGAGVAAEPRTGPPDRVAAAAARRVRALAPAGCTSIVLDAASTVGGATVLARAIAGRLRAADLTVHLVDDIRLARLAQQSVAAPDVPPPTPSTRHHPRWRWLWPAAALLAGVLLWPSGGRPATHARSIAPVTVVAPVTSESPGTQPMPTTILVEGRIAVQVPEPWPVQRVTTGPGSARVVLASPSNPQVALHVTQSPVRDETIADTAAAIQRALVDQPPGVFVDFTAAEQRAGRSAVTYREVRAGHDIYWSILLDDNVRISIGCQSPTGSDDAVRAVCEQAVRSAHTVR